MTPEQLALVMPRAPAEWLAALSVQMDQWGIDTAARQAAFVAQIAHESAELTRLEENLNYRAERLMQVWPKRFANIGQATLYEHNPEKLANYVYAGRNGNGDAASGDGWRFRGRGPTGLTGRANYARAENEIRRPLTDQPDLVATDPDVGCATACLFWMDRELNALADRGDFDGIVRRVNGGLTGIAEREAYWKRAKEALA